MGQWLGLQALTAEGPGSIPGLEKDPTGPKVRKKKKKKLGTEQLSYSFRVTEIVAGW